MALLSLGLILFTYSLNCCFGNILKVFETHTIDNVNHSTRDNINYRLPRDLTPENYDILIRPYLLESDASNRFKFDGEVFIKIKVEKSVNKILLHSKNLNYTIGEYWNLKNSSEKNILSLSVEPNSKTDIISYSLKKFLNLHDTYILHFVYKGTMDNDMHGFYRSFYTDNKNRTKWLGSTQFQTNHARRVFPCFDEPNFKATFHLSLKRHKSMKTISNTRLKNITLEGDYVIDHYQPTPVMSSYLLAFTFSEFNERFNGDFAVAARPEFYEQTDYSDEVGQKLLNVLDGYFNITYYEMGINKMHLVAIPDFSAGAMENWGLLTFRESSLLYSTDSSPLNVKQSIASIIAHEQAHMWFGNLVTCDWWSYTWLNEGFARYFQYFTTAEVEKNLEMDKQFVIDQIHTVMQLDSTNETNLMSNEDTNTPSDLSRMFNSISYNKGAAFIRMVKHVMGEVEFKKSLQIYLKSYQNRNTVPKNLFDIWKEGFTKSTEPYADGLFNSFTTQVGYPLITFNSTLKRVTQKRFLLKMTNNDSDPNLIYTVPITFTTNIEKDFKNTTPKLFLSPINNRGEELQLPSNISWLIGNIQQTGYYRVNYDLNNWNNIHQALLKPNWDGMHEINRAQIVDDLFNLARADIISYNLALRILEYLTTETNYLVWSAAFNGYNYLVTRLGRDITTFSVYIRKLTEKAYKKLGFLEKPNDSALDIYNRVKILTWSCKFGNIDCIETAKDYFNKNLNLEPVPVNIRSVVYCVAMREGNEDDFKKLFHKYQYDTISSEVNLLVKTMGCVKNVQLVKMYFNKIMSDDIRRQDKSTALTSLFSENNENVEIVFDLIAANPEQVANSLGSYESLASIIWNIAGRFTETSQEAKLKNFNAVHRIKFGESAKILDKSENIVAENLLWSSERLHIFKDYLKQHSNGCNRSSEFTIHFILFLLAFTIFI